MDVLLNVMHKVFRKTVRNKKMLRRDEHLGETVQRNYQL